jgi:putative transposase
MICDTFGINRSSYYTYRDRRNQVDVERMILRSKVKQVFGISRGSAVSRTIKSKLNDQGIEIGCFKVSRLMAESDLVCKQPDPNAYKQATVERPDIRNVLSCA